MTNINTTDSGIVPAVAAAGSADSGGLFTLGRIRPATFWSALIVLALGVLTVGAFYFPIRHLQAHDVSAPALAMPSMHMYRLNVFWSVPLLQAAGFAALIWAYLGLALGLLETGVGERWRWLPLTSGGGCGCTATSRCWCSD